MHFLVTGGTGLIGRAFVNRVVSNDHSVTILSRHHHPSQDSIRYINHLDQISSNVRIDTIVNLAGASLGDKRWTKKYKAEILRSRLETTKNLITLCDRLKSRPTTLLNASAVGYYGSREDQVLDERTLPGDNFSSDLCSQWEKLSSKMQSPETRVCILRLGVVFDRSGGALIQLSKSFHFKIGVQLGTGMQWMSWVHLEDAVRAMVFLVERDDLEGPFNITAPNPVRVSDLNRAISRQLPVIFTASVPGNIMRLALGQMATELLLGSQRVIPRELTLAGFNFIFEDLDLALVQCFEKG